MARVETLEVRFPARGEEASRPRREEPESGTADPRVVEPAPGAVAVKKRATGLRWMKKALLVLGTLTALFAPAAASPDEALERAIAFAGERRYAEAREVLDPLLKSDPDRPRARLLDGILRAREGRVSEAIEIFDRLRRDHPDLPEPWNNLAVLYATEGRFNEARETLLAALERKPSAIGYANLGDVYTNLARRAYWRARELEPDGDVHPEPGGKPETTLPSPSAVSRAVSAPAAESTNASTPVSAVKLGGAPGQVPAASGTVPGSAISCVRTGGVEHRRILAGAEPWLRSQGAQAIVVQRVERRAIRNHRVYLPPLADRAAAVAKVRELRAGGVGDVAVIGRGELANGISFGVFGVAENMRQRVAALERLGYPVRSKDNMKTVRQYVIEARTAGDPNALRAAWAGRFPELSLELVDCG